MGNKKKLNINEITLKDFFYEYIPDSRNVKSLDFKNIARKNLIECKINYFSERTVESDFTIYNNGEMTPPRQITHNKKVYNKKIIYQKIAEFDYIGLSQTQIANRLFLSQSTVSRTKNKIKNDIINLSYRQQNINNNQIAKKLHIQKEYVERILEESYC